MTSKQGQSLASSGDRRQGGFTLLEMIVVLTLVGLAMAVAVPALKNPNQAGGVKTAALTLAAELKAARVSAITGGSAISLHLLLQQRRYIRDGERSAGVFPQSISVTLYSRGGAPQGAPESAITFFPDGSSTGGVIVLTENRTAFYLTVDWLTGAIYTEVRTA